MDNRPIGIFDSGFGGLTAVRALRRLLPEEDIVFFADNGRAPYGDRQREQLRRMTRQDLSLLEERGVKAIIAACGTVSSNSADLLRANSTPTIGVLDATVEALRGSRGGPVGLIATEATVRSGVFEGALRAACPEREVLSVPCPDFVMLIESGRASADDPALQAAASEYLRPLRRKGIETLVLGCTHYGLIEPVLRVCLGYEVDMLDAACCAAEQMARFLRERDMLGGGGELRCLTSGNKGHFARLAPLFLGAPIPMELQALPPMEV